MKMVTIHFIRVLRFKRSGSGGPRFLYGRTAILWRLGIRMWRRRAIHSPLRHSAWSNLYRRSDENNGKFKFDEFDILPQVNTQLLLFQREFCIFLNHELLSDYASSYPGRKKLSTCNVIAKTSAMWEVISVAFVNMISSSRNYILVVCALILWKIEETASRSPERDQPQRYRPICCPFHVSEMPNSIRVKSLRASIADLRIPCFDLKSEHRSDWVTLALMGALLIATLHSANSDRQKTAEYEWNLLCIKERTQK